MMIADSRERINIRNLSEGFIKNSRRRHRSTLDTWANFSLNKQHMQKALRCTIIIVSLLGFPFLVVAQTIDIRGVVSDSITGARIPYANILLVGTSKGAPSNLEGFYLIPNVPPGAYDLAASVIGYERKVINVVVKPGKSVSVNFALRPQAVEVQGVTVTQEQQKMVQELTPSVHVLRQADIRMVPVAVQEDVFRALQVLPGIVSTSDVTSQFYVRGGAGDQNLILLDGMKIYGPFHALGLFSVFDADILQVSEIYTGAFPAGFGGKLSSVLNLRTRDARTDRLGVNVSGGFLTAKMHVEVPVAPGLSWLVNARKSISTEPYKRFLKRETPLAFYDFFSKVTAQSNQNQTRLSFQTLLSSDRLESPASNEPDYTWKNKAFGISISSLFQDRLFITAHAFGTFYEAQRDPKASLSVTPASTSVKEVGLTVDASVYTDAEDLYHVGFEMVFPTLESNLVNLSGVSQQVLSSYPELYGWFRVQSTFGYLKTDIGAHLNIGDLLQRNVSLSAVEPRLSLSYALWGDWKAKLAYGRHSQQTLTIHNEDDLISIFDYWICVPLKMKPEQADHFVAGMEGTLLQIIGTSIQSYYKHYGSILVYNRDKLTSTDPDYVNGTGASYGLELLVRYGSPRLNLYAAYTLSHTALTLGGFTYNPRYDRRHNLNLLSKFVLTDDISLTLRWEFGSGFPFTQAVGSYDRLKLGDRFPVDYESETGEPYLVLGQKNAARLPTYHRLDASFLYHFRVLGTEGAFSVSVMNVYDRKNPFYFDRKTGQRVNMIPIFPSATLQIGY